MLYDRDIREPLFDFLDETFGKNRIIEEKQIGKTRADVVMITENDIWGIEIKSDADTYARLDRQVKDYNRFFDYNMVVVGTSHAATVEEHVPEYWGIITVEEVASDKRAAIDSEDLGTKKDGNSTQYCPDFYLLRTPKRNPKKEKKIMFRNQLSFLWRPEIAHIQELNGMHKYANLSKIDVIKKVMETVPQETLKQQLCQELMERDYTKIKETLEEYRKSKGTKARRKIKGRVARKTDK